MLLKIPVRPGVSLVDPQTLLPRFWATVWASGFAVQRLSGNTVKARLRHIGAFYELCDQRYGRGALDKALGEGNAADVHAMVGDFYYSLTDEGGHKTSTVARWDAVRFFIRSLVDQLGALEDSWRGLSTFLESIGKIRRPTKGKFRFVRALPDSVLQELLQLANPENKLNPFTDECARWRNWLMLHLLLLCGLRRGEMLLLVVDSLKHDIDPGSGELIYWLDVTTVEEDDDRATRPSIKTEDSHRQIPVSADLAALYEHYVAEVRVSNDEDVFLLTSRVGAPLSAESVTKAFEKLTARLSAKARQRFKERTGGKRHISPHDLRHTSATARYAMFMAQEPNRELTLQRMRAFFGWSVTSNMPELYARAAIQDDLLRSWNDLFDQRVANLRTLES